MVTGLLAVLSLEIAKNLTSGPPWSPSAWPWPAGCTPAGRV